MRQWTLTPKPYSCVCQVLGADGLLYQSIDDLVAVGRELNPAIHSFDTSCFTGAAKPMLCIPAS